MFEMTNNNALSTEQEFELRKYTVHAQQASREALEELFVEVLRQKMVQENLFKGMIESSLF